MSGWFTTYTGYGWTPQNGYSDLFVSYVKQIREWFRLEKTGNVGIEVAKGQWIPYEVQGKSVKVILDRFEWMHYNSDGVYFVMKLRVGKNSLSSWLGRLLNRTTPFEVIFDEEVTVMFDERFPNTPPLFKINNPGYRMLTDLHEHHIFAPGIMCIMAGSDDWNPDRESILRAINAAIDWIVWHTDKWGNNPRRWAHHDR